MEGKRKGKAAWAKGGKPQSVLADTFYQYTHHSSMHGLKYVGDLTLHWSERLFWVIAFILGVMAAAYFINNLFTRFRENPVILSLTPMNIKLSEIPFPAVTICNMNNARRSKAETILKSGSRRDKKLLHDFCNDANVDAPEEGKETASWESIKKFMIDVAQPCHEMLVTCLWNEEPFECKDIFNPTFTDEGMCCSFNRVKREFIFKDPMDVSDINVTFTRDSIDWKPETGFPAEAPIDNLPWRSPGAGSHMGLSIVVDTEINEYFCSSESSIGFKIVLHNPIETPKINAFGTVVPPGKESRLMIVPKIMTSENTVEGIDLEKRSCYFIKERSLRYYRTYTQRNCLLECEANFTLSYCSCVLYHMPKGSDTRICGRVDVNCAKHAQRTVETKTVDPTVLSRMNNTQANCNCFPGCHEIGYSMISSASPLTDIFNNLANSVKGKNKTYFKENMAVIHLFFLDTQFTGTVRTRLFGFTEFLSNTGGLLGLFLGFSFLSAVEIGYYLSLRLWCSFVNKSKVSEGQIDEESEQIKYKTPFPFLQ